MIDFQISVDCKAQIHSLLHQSKVARHTSFHISLATNYLCWNLLLPQSLEGANELVGRLKEELAIRERLYQELRESKEKEVAELVKIKSDLEVKNPHHCSIIHILKM